MMKLDNKYFLSIRKQLWERVITGAINVYALLPKDTIPNKRGNIKHPLYLQKGENNTYAPFCYTVLSGYMRDIDTTNSELLKKEKKKGASKHMIVGGITLMASSGFSLAATGILALFSCKNKINLGHVATLATNGLAMGGTLMGSGFGLKENAQNISLTPVHFYNQNMHSKQ